MFVVLLYGVFQRSPKGFDKMLRGCFKGCREALEIGDTSSRGMARMAGGSHSAGGSGRIILNSSLTSGMVKPKTGRQFRFGIMARIKTSYDEEHLEVHGQL